MRHGRFRTARTAGCIDPMGTLALVIGVAVIAALGGYLVGRRPRRARRVFIAGFVCGSAAGSILQGRRRRLANHALRRVVGGGVAVGPRRSVPLFDEVRRHRPYSGNSRKDSHDHRRARNRTTVRT